MATPQRYLTPSSLIAIHCSRRPVGGPSHPPSFHSVVTGDDAKLSVALVEFAQQLLLQMPPRSLFYRATLSGYLLPLRLAFPPCSRFHRLRYVPDSGPARSDLSLFRFCVRIHENSPLGAGKLIVSVALPVSVRWLWLSLVLWLRSTRAWKVAKGSAEEVF
jgi:hypothetical protein